MGWFFKTTEDRLQEAEEKLAGVVAEESALQKILSGFSSISYLHIDQLKNLASKKAKLECRVNYLRRKLTEEKKGTVTKD